MVKRLVKLVGDVVASRWIRVRGLWASPNSVSASSNSLSDVKSLKRIEWSDFFFGLTFLISQRSPDKSTKHGCVAVNKNNQIISCGYNGFVRGVDDSAMPQTRPEKYLYILHAEENMLLNMVGHLESGEKVYISGTPCVPCFSKLLQAGFREFYVADRKGYTNPPLSQAEGLERLCRETGARLTVVKPNLDWLINIEFIKELYQLGFLHNGYVFDVEGGYIDLNYSKSNKLCEECLCKKLSTRYIPFASGVFCDEHCPDMENSRPHGWRF